MFEPGAPHEFRMIEDGGEVMFWGTVERYEHPLLKLQDTQPTTVVRTVGDDPPKERGTIPSIPGAIINVTSTNFVSAHRKNSPGR